MNNECKRRWLGAEFRREPGSSRQRGVRKTTVVSRFLYREGSGDVLHPATCHGHMSKQSLWNPAVRGRSPSDCQCKGEQSRLGRTRACSIWATPQKKHDRNRQNRCFDAAFRKSSSTLSCSSSVKHAMTHSQQRTPPDVARVLEWNTDILDDEVFSRSQHAKRAIEMLLTERVLL